MDRIQSPSGTFYPPNTTLSLRSAQSEEAPLAKWDTSGPATGLGLLIPLTPWLSLGPSGCPQLNPAVILWHPKASQ